MTERFIEAKGHLDRAICRMEVEISAVFYHLDALGMTKPASRAWPTIEAVRAAFEQMNEIWGDDLYNQVRGSEKAAGQTLLAILDFAGRGGQIIPPSAPEDERRGEHV